MKSDDRQRAVLHLLGERGELNLQELATEFAVSEMTVRRDVQQLVEAGLAVQTRGSVSPSARGSFEPPFALRAHLNVEAKRRIASAVADGVQDGQTIILDGGSTGLAIAEALVGRGITVCTMNLRAAEVLSRNSATRVMLPGGFLRAGELTLTGDEATHLFERYRFDAYIMTASGVDLAGGVTEWNAEDAAVKRAALHAAGRAVLACDASKFGRRAFAVVCSVADVESMVTDQGVPDELANALTAAGLDLKIA